MDTRRVAERERGAELDPREPPLREGSCLFSFRFVPLGKFSLLSHS